MLLGWPAIILATVLAVISVRAFKPMLSLLALIIVAPISFYLAGTPRFGWLGVSLPLFLIALGVWGAVRQYRASGR